MDGRKSWFVASPRLTGLLLGDASRSESIRRFLPLLGRVAHRVVACVGPFPRANRGAPERLHLFVRALVLTQGFDGGKTLWSMGNEEDGRPSARPRDAATVLVLRAIEPRGGEIEVFCV
jgi:hypothetical protein